MATLPANTSSAAAAPRVTLIMTVRERFSPTVSAIESVMANTAMPFRLVFADMRCPPWLSEAVGGLARRHGFRVVRFDDMVWPQQVRKDLVGSVDTEYVVFLDNDLRVYPGWLEKLVECADETGAGLVGPLYLWGDDVSPPRVHMAGGLLQNIPQGDRRVLIERHNGYNADPDQAAAALGRSQCDFLEFHCMLLRTSLAQQPELLDPRIASVHEHIDVALSARGRGHAIYLETASRVLYRAFIPTTLEDLSLMLWRWSPAAVEASIAAFSAKWRVIDDERSFGSVRDYAQKILSNVALVRQASRRADLDRPVQAGELVQTRSGLLDLAAARGYAPAELADLALCYGLAARLLNGGFRPCGRPFINHLTGTAAVLLRYDLRIETVAAGLLHAAYSHGWAPGDDAAAQCAGITAQLGQGSPVERRVRAYAQRGGQPLRVAGGMTLDEAEIALIEAANEIDMRFSGEYDYSGRPPEIDEERLAGLMQVCRAAGLDGLAQTLRLAAGQVRQVIPALVTGISASYRLAGNGSLQPMARSAASLRGAAPVGPGITTPVNPLS